MDSFPTFQGAWQEAQGWASPLPRPAIRAIGQPVTGESFYYLSLFWSSCWVGGCPLGSQDWLGITSPPKPLRSLPLKFWAVLWIQLCRLGHTKRPSPGLSFSLSPNGETWHAGLPGLTLLPGFFHDEPAGSHLQLSQPPSGLEGEGAGKVLGPPARLPEGWEMSRQGN